ncbi:MAG TPA: tetratricopeptide repeat protein [Bryobacteraceae bacterium]|nr:tetratricopeptide repeat protein [Bryobacteraceae bacterium]
MVSKLCFVAITLAAALAFAAAPPQSTPPPSPSQPAAFLDGSRTGQAPAVQPPKTTLVTPEMRGDIFMAKKMYREAAEAYKEGAQNSAVLLNKTGIAYHQMLDFGTAEKYYRLAVKANPHYAEAINNLGTIYYAHKSYRRAVNEYKKALRINPESASMWSNLGTGYFARKDYPQASDCYQKALSLDPEVFESHSSHGVLLQERTVEERAKFHYYLAKTYAKAGMNERALLYIRKSIEEGFKERKKYEQEPEFAPLKDLPEFKQLLAMEPRVL